MPFGDDDVAGFGRDAGKPEDAPPCQTAASAVERRAECFVVLIGGGRGASEGTRGGIVPVDLAGIEGLKIEVDERARADAGESCDGSAECRWF